jgi:peptidoglycan pentaglycine glycine transferase (the first glycine)
MFDKWFELAEQPYTEEDAAWDRFVADHPQGSILQTTNWARLKNRFNWSSQRVWLKQDGRFAAGAQVLFKSAALGLLKIAYVPHGPLVDWHNDEQVTVLLNQIDQAVYQRGAGLVKLEPLLWQADMPPDKWADFCQRHHLSTDTDTIQPPNTIVIDLRPSLDDILAAMKQKTRYNIRLAERKEVTVRHGTASDLPAFNALMQETAQRDGFGVHSPLYYRDVFNLFAPDDHLALFVAEYEARPLAAIMVSAYAGKAIYLYGASGNEERARMPTYALQWAAIQWAKAKGCATYDLWGIPDAPEAELEAGFTDRHDGLWGVYRAKRGYGGEIRRTVGAADRIYNRYVHRLYQWRRSRS